MFVPQQRMALMIRMAASMKNYNLYLISSLTATGTLCYMNSMIKMDLKKIGWDGTYWINMALDRDR
jgi:ubiquitin C-terminal hydrolase